MSAMMKLCVSAWPWYASPASNIRAAEPAPLVGAVIVVDPVTAASAIRRVTPAALAASSLG